MHHYPFHVGDYIRATAHLDLIEDCIYRRLIDLYMETEQPIPNETQQVIRRLRLGSSGLILETILQEFFTLESDNCWHNSRCDNEINEFRRLAEVSRINGKLGGRPKKTQQVILDNPEITQKKPAGLQPIPNTQEPIPNLEKKKRATTMPENFYPCDTAIENLKNAGISVQAEISKFSDYCLKEGKVYKNWQAAFRNWASNAIEWKKPTKAQDAKLAVAERLFGKGANQNGTDSKIIDITPAREIENSGKDIPKISNSIRQPLDF